MKKHFKIDLKNDLPHMLDAVFTGSHGHQPSGWVLMDVNDEGRAHVEALFLPARIRWRDPCLVGFVPSNWHGFEIHVPGVVAWLTERRGAAQAFPETKLPLEIARGLDLNVVNPDALAFLLAVGVVRQGGRAAVFRNDRLEIVRLDGHAWN
jgi:hypothetical protein